MPPWNFRLGACKLKRRGCETALPARCPWRPFLRQFPSRVETPEEADPTAKLERLSRANPSSFAGCRRQQTAKKKKKGAPGCGRCSPIGKRFAPATRFDPGLAVDQQPALAGYRAHPPPYRLMVMHSRMAETAPETTPRTNLAKVEDSAMRGTWLRAKQSCVLRGSCSPIDPTEANRSRCCVCWHGQPIHSRQLLSAALPGPCWGTRTQEQPPTRPRKRPATTAVCDHQTLEAEANLSH